MANNDFVIQNGVLKKYNGTDSTVVVPKGVKVIGDEAFSKNKTIKIVKLPAGVTEIDDGAFLGCTFLETLKMKEGVTRIGFMAFFGCSFLKNIKLPLSLKTIDCMAFGCCNSIKLKIPKNVSDIKGGIFTSTINNKNVKIDKANKYYLIESHSIYTYDKKTFVSYVGDSKSFCIGSIVKTVENIAPYACYGSDFKNIWIWTNNIKKIGEHAFDMNLNLEIEIYEDSYKNSTKGESWSGVAKVSVRKKKI